MKNDESRCRSESSISAAAVSGGNASRPRIDEIRYIQQVIDIRQMESPTARRFRIVTMKFRPPMVNEKMKSAIASSQSVWPIPEPGRVCSSALSGGYAVQPAAAEPPSARNENSISRQPGTTVQYDSMFRNGYAMSRAPMCSGMMKFAMPDSASDTTKNTISVPCIVTSDR